jgi:3-dehydroquinate dehydratase/shikimate dehydrogenase
MLSDNSTRICIPLNETTVDALIAAIERVSHAADLIELRLDALERGELEKAAASIGDVLSHTSRPVILTLRTKEQGGYREIEQEQRLELWETLLASASAFFDLEYDLVTELTKRNEDEQPDWSRVICSHHDFAGVPHNLEEIFEQLTFTPARVVKLAVSPAEITDCLAVLKLLDRAVAEERDTIAIAMGSAGVLTRILGPSRGAFLTYGASEAERGTAAGQIVAADLRSIFRVDQIDSETMITGLVGQPVMHSVSPHMHNAAFQAAGLNGVYLPFEVEDLDRFIQRMVNPETRELEWNLRGLSITSPHKAGIIRHLDLIDPTARAIGAVNTVVVENEQLHGYNTDADGLIDPLRQRLGALAGSRAAVIGAGGAARAAVFGLQKQGVDVTLCARDRTKAELLGSTFNISCSALSSATSFSNYDIVINATPLGSLGLQVDQTPVSAEQLRGSRLVYDLVYNPLETKFMKEGREAGCEVLGGLEMLVAQAQLQFKIWTNTTISLDLMHEAGLSALQKNSSFIS